MALTLLEAAKGFDGDVIRQGVIEMFAKNSDLLRVLPFVNIEGNAYKYNQEDTLPGVGFRGVNEAYSTQAVGVLNPITESLVIAGGDVDVDPFIVATMGEGKRASQENMKIKALAQAISHKFIKGDSTTDPKEFDGLQARVTGNQLIANGASSGGDVLSLAKLDEAIDAVDGPNALYMSKAMRRTLTSAARNTSVGGYIRYDKDEFGRQITLYNDLPILIADGNADNYTTLAFDEANPGGGSTVGTSIYVLGMGEGQFTGMQNGPMQVRDLGETQSGAPALRTRIEWYVSPLVEHGRSVSRLWGIKSGAAVA